MGSKVEEAERGADFLEGPRPSNTGTEGASGKRVYGINNLVHRSSPPSASLGAPQLKHFLYINFPN